jgi:hypothetical protein
MLGTQGSSVGTTTGYELDYRRIGIQVRLVVRMSCLPHVVQTGSRTHPASSPVATGDKAAVGCSLPLASKLSRDQENVDLYIHFHIRLRDVVPS